MGVNLAPVVSILQLGNRDAENIAYDNTDSGLTATNVQDAVDEISMLTYSASSSEMRDGGSITITHADLSAKPARYSLTIEEFVPATESETTDIVAAAFEGNYTHENVAIGATYTATKLVIDTAGTKNTSATGHFTNTAGDHSITCGAGNDCEKIVPYVHVVVDGTVYNILSITDDGEGENEIVFYVGVMAEGTYDVDGIYASEMIGGNIELAGTGVGNDENTKLLCHWDDSTNDVAAGATTTKTVSVIGSPAYVTGTFGKALSLNGSSGVTYANVGDDFTIGTSAFDFHTLFNVTNYSSQRMIFRIGGTDAAFNSTTGHELLVFVYTDGKIYAQYVNTSFSLESIKSASAVSTGVVHDLQVRSSGAGGTLEIILDGDVVASGAMKEVGAISGTRYVCVGNERPLTTCTPFLGTIDETRFSNILRAAEEIEQPYGSSGFPVTTVSSILTKPVQTEWWNDILSSSVDDTLPTGTTAYYAVKFDSGNWTMFNGTSWREIVKNNAGTWQYKDAADAWQDATVNNEHYAISQATAITENQMDETILDAMDVDDWSAAGGWSESVDDLYFAVTLGTTEIAYTPSLTNFQLTFNADACYEPMPYGYNTDEFFEVRRVSDTTTDIVRRTTVATSGRAVEASVRASMTVF